MDKLILNGNKIRIYGTNNLLSGSIQYDRNRLKIQGNSSGSGILVTDGKLSLKNGLTTASIVYNGSSITANRNISTPSYLSGFNGYGYTIGTSSSGRTLALFDDLWVRGSMNVYEMVINQVRATNGSLWVSDAVKATSASYDGFYMYLHILTGSICPFLEWDVIRSKRWTTQGSDTSSIWDAVFYVLSVDYETKTLQLHPYDYYTSSECGTFELFTSKLSLFGSDWVRVGSSNSDENRAGYIYITSTDTGGPFIDICDELNSVADVINGNGTATQSKVKARLGKLDGISGCSGYGLYSNNVFLTGTVSATAGNIGSWTINSANISTSGIVLTPGTSPYIGVGNTTYGSNGIWIGKDTLYKFSAVNGSNKLLFDGTNIGISTSNFTLSNGKITAQNAIISGSIQANTGYIGGASGWQITSNKITHSSGILFSASTTPAIKIGAASYGTEGIWMGKNNKYSMSLYADASNYFKWNGANLLVKAGNFSLSTAGNISASNALFGGSIYSTNGNIGGWSIDTAGLKYTAGINTVSVATNGINPLVLVDPNNNSRYNYSQSQLLIVDILNNYLLNMTGAEYNKWSVNSSYCSSSIDKDELYITCSKFIVTGNTSIFSRSQGVSISPNKLYMLRSNNTSPRFNDYRDYSKMMRTYINIYTSSNYNASSLLYTFIDRPLSITGRLIDEQIYEVVYTGSLFSPTLYIALMLQYDDTYGGGSSELRDSFNYTFSGIQLSEFKHITELSLKGLLVFNNPNNYLQLSAVGITNSSNIAVSSVNTNILNADIINAPLDPIYKNIPVMCNVLTTTSAAGSQWIITREQILQQLDISDNYKIHPTPMITPYIVELAGYSVLNAGDVNYYTNIYICTSSDSTLDYILGSSYPTGTYSVAIVCKLI